MNFDINIRHLLAGLGACMSLLVVASPANARPDSSVGSGIAPQQQRQVASTDPATIRVIPYLSHGTLKPAQSIKVIPQYDGYKSGYPQLHQLLAGTTIKAAAGTQATDNSDVISRYVRSHEAKESRTASWYLNEQNEPLAYSDGTTPRIAGGPATREQPDGYQPQTPSAEVGTGLDSGFDWQTTGFVAGSLAAGLLAAAMMIALRHRRGGLRSA
jgi:hypothetical protein